MIVNHLCYTFKENALPVPAGSLRFSADKKASKEAAEGLPYGPQTLRTAKGSSKQAS